MLDAFAIVLRKPETIEFRRLPLAAPTDGDVVVRTEWSGISTGTERLLFRGRMPDFPGMGYPLVPGYESVGTVVQAGPASPVREGTRVFVPGARCFGDVRGLFGGAASQLVTSSARVVPVAETLGEKAILMALAATARHALGDVPSDGDLIVGHGVLGRLLARLACLSGRATPVVWETDSRRQSGADGYRVLDPAEDSRHDYRRIFDVSGDPAIIDRLVARLAPGGEIVLAGFYEAPLSFAFPPAFMREARLRIAAEWRPADLLTVRDLVDEGRLSLDGLITHHRAADKAHDAYPTAFEDSSCLKMVLDWRQSA